ncbi:MAG TPA: hypothetical protein VHC46_08690, partial [Thermodesulfobacteriota bacterium]|nr:hypothetical protein [Thermodesulfobacteriota bacterium]
VPATPPTFVDCDCYNQDGDGVFAGEFDCQPTATDDVGYAINPFEFQGGRSNFISGTLTGLNTDGLHTYVVQVITAQKAGLCASGPIVPGDIRSTTGALVDNFRNIESVITDEVCDGTLTGEINAFLTNFVPTEFAGQFNKIDDNEAGGDAILINFADQYLPNYRTLPAFVTASITIWDDFEVPLSCGDIQACYLRLGIDESIGISDDFTSPTPSVTTAPPTTQPPVTPTPPTTPPTHKPGGGGGSCAIAGSPVQLGTAFANVLIPLVPVAFAFGVRAARRRRNK